MTWECLPKVGIKLLKISNVRILFLVSFLFVAVINLYSVFKFLIFKYSSFTFIVYLVWIHNINRGYLLGAWFLLGNKNKMFIGTYLIMLVYRHLLTITLTWQSSCIITNYNWKTSRIYLFKHVILLFWSWWCKEVHMKTWCLL